MFWLHKKFIYYRCAFPIPFFGKYNHITNPIAIYKKTSTTIDAYLVTIVLILVQFSIN